MAIKKAVSTEDQSVAITFENGETASHTLAALTPEMVGQLALHGLSQKLGDSYAGAKDQAQELVANVWKNLTDGNWSVRGEGGTRVTQLARALVRKLKAAGKEITEADAAEKIAELDDDAKKALNSACAVEIAAIKAEDAKVAAEKAAAKAASGEGADIDVASLLGA